jgi:Immunoglobulin I-set domain
MSTCRNARLSLLFLVPIACLMVLGTSVGKAFGASAYGELSRFESGVESAGNAHAFAVDAAEGDTVFIGSEPTPHQYLIKKFSETGTELASVKFTPPAGEYSAQGTQGIEGFAIDEGRLYVLVLSEEIINEVKTEVKRDAGALYAFSTKGLTPASGITDEHGLFASTTTLNASSKSHAHSNQDPLIEPAGIAADPTTHEVIILGWDEESNVFPAAPHLALQRVAINQHAPSGTPAGELASRYINPQEDHEGEAPARDASSPAVSAAGNVFFDQASNFVKGEQELVEVPRNFAAVAPKPVYTAFTNFEAEKLDETEELVEFPAAGEVRAAPSGGGLAFTPDGKALYAYALIAEDESFSKSEEEFESTQNPGVLELNYAEHEEVATVSELGWTAGQRPARVESKGAPEVVPCSIGPGTAPGGENLAYPLVSAGEVENKGSKEDRLFVLGWTAAGKVGKVETKKPIVEVFGVGGTGCNAAHGPEPEQIEAETNEGKAVTEAQTVSANAELILTSYIFDGNALEAEWNFDEGGEPLLSKTDEHQESIAKHVFECNSPGGTEPLITEKIHTDNLATPEITLARKVKLKEVKPVVHKSPESVSVPEGSTATFTARAGGCKLGVQWEESTNGGSSFTVVSGATSETLKIASTKMSESGDQYRAKFSNGLGSATSKDATLTVTAGGGGEAPKVTKQPVNAEVEEGKEAKFEASASGSPEPSVQWEVSTNGGVSFAAVSGATSETLKIASAKVSESGDEFRATFSNGVLPNAVTGAATLTVNPHKEAPKITKQPVNAEVEESEEAKFEATASGAPVPTVQWEMSTNKGASFAVVSGATSNTLKIASAKVSESGNEYRATFSNGVLPSAVTNPATLTVNLHKEAPKITKQPVDAEVTEGEEAKFASAASGAPAPTVQWEVSTNKGVSFTAVSGATSDTLKITDAKVSESGHEYRATFSNGVLPNAVTSAVKLVVRASVAPEVTKQPVSTEVTEGEEAKFEATASGAPAPTVQWEVSTNKGVSFAAVSGATSDALKIPGTAVTQSGYEYRATFSNGTLPNAATNVATLTVKAKPAEPPKEAPKETQKFEEMPGPGHGVLPEMEGSPAATVAGTSLTVTPGGAFVMKIKCSGTNVKSCTGTITLRTLTAVSASARGRLAKAKKKAILTLATASYTVAGGQSKSVTVHLSGKGRTLLAHSHTLRVRVTIVAHDPAGGAQTTTTVATLHLAKAHHHG